MTDDASKIFQCKYCSYTGHWAKDVARHQRTSHPTCPPHVLQRDYVSEDGESNDAEEEDDDDDDHDHEGLSALMIDPVRAFGEVIDPMENNNGDDFDDMDSQDEEIVPANDEDEDDEDDA